MRGLVAISDPGRRPMLHSGSECPLIVRSVGRLPTGALYSGLDPPKPTYEIMR
jgi:hypothetical protein